MNFLLTFTKELVRDDSFAILVYKETLSLLKEKIPTDSSGNKVFNLVKPIFTRDKEVLYSNLKKGE